MNKTKRNYLMVALMATALSPAYSHAQEIVVGVVQGHKIMNSTREADAATLCASIISDLAKQGCTDLMNPKSGTYQLYFGGSAPRINLYIEADKEFYFWDSSSEILKFTHPDLPNTLLTGLMQQGKMKQLNFPTREQFAVRMSAELAAKGINLKTPQNQKVCLNLGYQSCKVVVDFSEKGVLEYHLKGTPFAKADYADAMIHLLQATGNFKNADGSDLAIYAGAAEKAEPEVEKKLILDTAMDQPEPPKEIKASTGELVNPTMVTIPSAGEGTIAGATDTIESDLETLGDDKGTGNSGTGGNGSGGQGMGKHLGRAVRKMIEQVEKNRTCPSNFHELRALKRLANKKLRRNEHVGVNVDAFVGKNNFVCGYNYSVSEWKKTDVKFEDADTYISNLATDYTKNKRHDSGDKTTAGYWFQSDSDQDKAGESSYRGGPGIPRNPDTAFFKLSEHVLLEIVSNYGEIGFVGILSTHK